MTRYDDVSREYQRSARRFNRFMLAIIGGTVLWVGFVWYAVVHFIVKFW